MSMPFRISSFIESESEITAASISPVVKLEDIVSFYYAGFCVPRVLKAWALANDNKGRFVNSFIRQTENKFRATEKNCL